MDKPKSSEEQPNIYELQREKKEIIKAFRKAPNGPVRREAQEQLEKIKEETRKFHIKDVGGLSEAKKLFSEARKKSEASAWMDEKAISVEMGEDYLSLSGLVKELADLEDYELRQLRESKNDSHAKKAYEKLRTVIIEEKKRLQQEIAKIEGKNPDAARALELISYAKGLHQEGHIAMTPQVKGDLAEIGKKMISGNPILLFGPTGTGKTSEARLAAKHFTGKEAEIIYCSPQTKPSDMWGKTGLRPVKGEEGKHGAIETFDAFGPLAKAMRDGKVIIFDEFTALNQNDQLEIKGLFGVKPGEYAQVKGNGMVKIKPGFQMIFTANLKSEKHSKREELLHEITRLFEQSNLEVNYNPRNEAYDIMLSRLMNQDGSVDMSYYDLNVTLPKLAEAMEEIQIAYNEKTSEQTACLVGEQDVSKKIPGLKKFVMTQGTIEVIIDEWKTTKMKGEKICFAEFLDQALKRGLTFKEYPEKDRILAAKILALKGFLRTISAKDLNLSEEIFNVSAIKSLRGKDSANKLREKSSQEVHIPLSEIAKLDPFKLRKKKVMDEAAELLPSEEEKNQEIRVEFSEVVEREEKSLREFFGYDIKVLDLPKEITPEQYEKWKEMGFELHYFPAENLTEDRDLPGWKKKPGKKYTPGKWGIEFFDEINAGNLPQDSTKLSEKGNWVLVDTRNKPNYDNGKQMYENDELIGGIIKKLREEGKIRDYKITGIDPGITRQSRFNLSWEEITSHVLPELAKAMGVKPEQIRLERAIEYNFLGNKDYPKRGDTNTYEWQQDKFKGQRRLYGGTSYNGGLSYVHCYDSSHAHVHLGFRPKVVFSSSS